MSPGPISVVGIGADGWAGLAPGARARLLDAEVVLGGPRQLELLPAEVGAERVALPAPLLPALSATLDRRMHGAQIAAVDADQLGVVDGPAQAGRGQ